MRFIVCGAAALILAACQTAQAPRGQPVTLTAAQIASIQSAVRGTMREPASAEFLGQPRGVGLPSGEVIVCGAVKGRNGFGGMTDWQPYAGTLLGDQFRAERVGGTPHEMEVTMMTCRDFGVHG